MKKTILGILTTLIAVIALTGCSMFAKANGVILYGEEEEILDACGERRIIKIKVSQPQKNSIKLKW